MLNFRKNKTKKPNLKKYYVRTNSVNVKKFGHVNTWSFSRPIQMLSAKTVNKASSVHSAQFNRQHHTVDISLGD